MLHGHNGHLLYQPLKVEKRDPQNELDSDTSHISTLSLIERLCLSE